MVRNQQGTGLREMDPVFGTVGPVRSRTPIGRLVTMAEVTSAALALLNNPGINGVNLPVDGGFLLK